MYSLYQVTNNLISPIYFPELSVVYSLKIVFLYVKNIFIFFSLFDKLDERRKKLNDRYGFMCKCNLCEMDGTQSLEIENSRLKYKQLENQITSSPNPKDILPLMKEKYEMMGKGQIMYPRFIRMHAFDCIQLALAFGNHEEANKYVQKGYESILT